jgi:predicted O-methyltransferase YrrM
MGLRRLLGLLDYYLHSRLSAKLNPWGFAMNGMTSRLEATRQIIYALKIERIVETGTFRGTTAEWFSQFGLPFETIEVYERYAAFSQARLRRYRNASIFFGSSVPYLKTRAASGIPKHTRQLFYLDAHWEYYLPLREELEIIFSAYDDAVVLIDDFMVEGDAGYGYDRYSEENSLTLDYISKSNLPRLWCFFPATPSSQETGARRGWVVLTNSKDLARQLEKISLLRIQNAF